MSRDEIYKRLLLAAYRSKQTLETYCESYYYNALICADEIKQLELINQVIEAAIKKDPYDTLANLKEWESEQRKKK